MSRRRLIEMETFLRVADTGSFSAAARLTGGSQSQVSQIVKALEDRLGVRLVNRTTRRLSLTEAGATFYRDGRSALAAIERAEEDARGTQAAIRGKLRINTSAMLGAGLVVPAAIAFQANHPELKIETLAEERRIDPIEEAIDLIVRIGSRSDLTLVGRRAGAAEAILVASPAYLARCGTPSVPDDLRDHEFIGLAERGLLDVPLTDPSGKTEVLSVEGRLAVSSGVLVQTAARAGVGIGFTLRFLVAEDIADRRLIHVLPTYRSVLADIHLYHPFGRTPPRKVSTFIAFAVDYWRRTELLDA